ncbi:ArgS-related anticodon-binding protein NrtL [Streptomyces sp. G-G2]|uniref:ArgS-related anticodon-binding protein NrtL n=1 Tax=Streptomyces sp. G-G2 TaxID=3046201 RepID=UPI0024BABA30|nr:DALR anticodon-binding domain-containing protein [Streptomyces sp. G-G2]MDJ0379352.1 DALR anticodon-binding domain-containing protein [Streptomyces sp. G-G2]
MTPADLSRTVVRAVRCAVEDGELGAGAAVPERVVVERTRPGGAGEYASPVALQLAKASGRPPAEVAALLALRLRAVEGIERVEITGPGFLNFTLRRGADDLAELVRRLRIRQRYGADAPDPADAPGLDLRARAVREAVVRILRAHDGSGEGVSAAAEPSRVAPVAPADGDVVRRFGRDAARWAMLATDPEQPPFFDGVLLVQGEASEFFRVRYAVSRARALARGGALLGVLPGPLTDVTGLSDGRAPALLAALADYPLALEAAAHHRAPERLARHLVTLADALLDFQYEVLPMGDEKPSAAHRSRLAVAEAAGTVLAGGLTLLGVDIPEVV